MKDYFAYFQSNPALRAWLWVLLSFKVVDGLAGPVLKPFLVDVGLSLSQIGLYITMLGAVAALAGALLAGLCLKYWARDRALLIFSLTKVGTFMAYAGFATAYQYDTAIAPQWLYLLNAIDDALSSMLLVVMLTIVMQYSRQHHAGTDFTVQVAVMATVSGALYTVSGIAAEQLGYAHYLWLISLLASICMMPIYRWLKHARMHDQMQ